MRRRKHKNRGRRGEICSECTLDRVCRGEEMEIVSIPEGNARISALRFGIGEGARVACAARIPAGPIVLRSGRQEVAVGRGLARRIQVKRLGRAS